MPKTFPRAPLPVLAALVSPLAWLYGRPDLFDTYSCGVLLMQMSGAPCGCETVSKRPSTPAALLLKCTCTAPPHKRFPQL